MGEPIIIWPPNCGNYSGDMDCQDLGYAWNFFGCDYYEPGQGGFDCCENGG